MEHAKIELLLEMLMYLSSGIKRTKNEIAERFNLSERSVYRYLDTFKQAGFVIPKPVEGRYFIDKNSPYFREIDELLHFSKEEATLLQKAIQSISNENVLKQNLTSKLYALYDFDRVADTIVKQENSDTIHQLVRAISTQKCVLLKGYESANSNVISNRVVEPFDFTINYIATWAYDIKDGKCKTFKNTRIKSVQILKRPWQHADAHKKLPMDIFRISNKDQIKVKVELSLRAKNLLVEEYPLAETQIEVVGNKRFLLKTHVCGFEGIARFVMGMCEDVNIIYPTQLKKYIKDKAKKIVTDKSWQ